MTNTTGIVSTKQPPSKQDNCPIREQAKCSSHDGRRRLKSFDNRDLHDPRRSLETSRNPPPMSMSHQIHDRLPGPAGLGGCQTTANRPNGPATAEMAIHDFGRFGYGTQPVRTSDESLAPVFARFPSPMRGSADPCIDRQGTRLAFASGRHGATHDSYVRPIDGSASTRITNDAAEDVMPAFSPDGTTLAFASDRSGNYDIWMINIGGATGPLTTDDARTNTIRPTRPMDDGLPIARNPHAQRGEIWYIELRHPEPSSLRRLWHRCRNGHRTPPSPCLHSSVHANAARIRTALWTIRIDDEMHGRPTEIASTSNAAAINPTWSPDARRIAFATVTNDDAGEQTMDLWTITREEHGPSTTTAPARKYQPVGRRTDDLLRFKPLRTLSIWSVADGDRRRASPTAWREWPTTHHDTQGRPPGDPP